MLRLLAAAAESPHSAQSEETSGLKAGKRQFRTGCLGNMGKQGAESFGSTGGSSWTAGGGSFAMKSQPGRVWRRDTQLVARKADVSAHSANGNKTARGFRVRQSPTQRILLSRNALGAGLAPLTLSGQRSTLVISLSARRTALRRSQIFASTRKRNQNVCSTQKINPSVPSRKPKRKTYR
jgi:hypothetical protein